MGTLLFSFLASGIALGATGETGSIVLDVGEPVDLGTGGGWGKAFPRGDGDWWLVTSSNHEYRLWELSAGLLAGPENDTKGLTGNLYPCVDHAMSVCPDGTYLHVCSGNVESDDDSAYYFKYDSDFEIFEDGIIAERDPDYRYNDAPILCMGGLEGTVFHPNIEEWAPFVTLDGGAWTDDPPFTVNPVPPIPGNALIYEDFSDTVLRFGGEMNVDDTLTIDRLQVGVNQPLDRTQIGMLGEDYEVYWPQSVEQVADLYFLAHMGRPKNQDWYEDLGNVYLAIFDDQLSVIEQVQLTYYEPEDVGAMRPFITIQDDVLLAVFDAPQGAGAAPRPFGLKVLLDLDQIADGNRAPTADAGPDTDVVLTEAALLDGRGTSDPNDDPLKWEWRLLQTPDDSALTSEDLKGSSSELGLFFPDVVGRYKLSLTVDDGTWTDKAETVVNVIPAVDEDLLADEPPVAIATGPDQAVTGDEAEMDGGASYDLDGDRLDVVWSLLSVPEASAVTDADLIEPTRVSSSFVPDVVGDYTLLLVVDDGQRTSTDVVVVTAIGRYQGCSALPGQTGGKTLLFSLLVALAWGIRRRDDQCPEPGSLSCPG